MGGINDPELEKKKTIEEIQTLITQRMNIYRKEIKDIKYHFEKNEKFFENVAVIGGDNTLREIQQSSKTIVQYFNEALEVLEKYKDKIKIEKAKKYFKKICNAANQRDVEEMRQCKAEFIYYCDYHYRY